MPAAFGFALIGAVLTAFGALLLPDHELPWIIRVGFLAAGLPTLIVQVRHLIVRTPRARATLDGVWFGGGRIVPWSDISAIYEAGLNVRVHGISGRTSSIAFDFHRKRTLLRVPIGCWLVHPLAVGDIDVSPHAAIDKAHVLAARLEAMRTRARGTEDAVTAGASDIPPARIVE